MNKQTADEDELALINAFESVKGIKAENLHGYVVLPDYGVTADEVEQLIKKFVEPYKSIGVTSNVTDDDINRFFGSDDWKKLTVHEFYKRCFNLAFCKRRRDRESAQARTS